jgi:hypothetical protein
MKRLFRSLILLFFCIVIFDDAISAGYISNEPDSISGYQSLNYGSFFMCYKWFCADSLICPVAWTVMSDGTGEEYIEISNYFFQEFDYEPADDFRLLSPIHNRDHFSIHKEESASFKVRHNDTLNNPPSSGYPKLILKCPDGSTQTHTMNKI